MVHDALGFTDTEGLFASGCSGQSDDYLLIVRANGFHTYKAITPNKKGELRTHIVLFAEGSKFRTRVDKFVDLLFSLEVDAQQRQECCSKMSWQLRPNLETKIMATQLRRSRDILASAICAKYSKSDDPYRDFLNNLSKDLSKANPIIRLAREKTSD